MSQAENPSYGVYALLNNTLGDRSASAFKYSSKYGDDDEEKTTIRLGIQNTNDYQESEFASPRNDKRPFVTM